MEENETIKAKVEGGGEQSGVIGNAVKIKTEPKDAKEIDTMENAIWESTVGNVPFESVMIKEEPMDDLTFEMETTENENLNNYHATEEEQGENLICGLPAPNTKISDQEQPRNIVHKSKKSSSNLIEKPQLKCDYCSKLFDCHRKLTRHTKEVHTENSEPCEVCGRFIKGKSHLKQHMLRHSQKPQLKCAECQKVYHSEFGLYLHVQSIHLGVKYKCDECPKSFSFKSNLVYHKRVKHSVDGEIVKFECDFCFKTFRYKHNLLTHIKCLEIKMIEKQQTSNCVVYPNAIKLKKNIEKQTSLNKTIHKIGNETEDKLDQSYPCDICHQAVFKKKVNLKLHMTRAHRDSEALRQRLIESKVATQNHK